MNANKILIVDDHSLLVDSLKMALESKKYEIVGTVKDAELSLVYCQRLQPNLVIMDVLTENNSDGIKACENIKTKYPNIRVLVMTGFNETSFILRAQKAKADGFIYKDKPLSEIIEQIELCLVGKGTFPEYDMPEEIHLTPRELDVLNEICAGKTRKEIAKALFVSEDTVKSHIANLFIKTKTTSKAELAIYAISNGLVSKQK